MSATGMGGADGIEELYRQLATHRAEQAHAALGALLSQPERLFS